MKNIAGVFLLASLMTGCVALPDIETMNRKMYNVPSSGTSTFDSTKYIRMSNIACLDIMFRLYQDTAQSKKGVVILQAGRRLIDNIGDGESLQIKIDGEVTSFKSSSNLTEHETIYVQYGVTMPFSHKTYILPESYIRKIAASQVFLTKVNLLNNTFIEGKCSTLSLLEVNEYSKKFGNEITQEHADMANQVAAIHGFREFVNMMDKTKW